MALAAEEKKGIENETKRGWDRGWERGATLLDLLCVNTRTVSIVDSLYPSVRAVFCTILYYISHLVARISYLVARFRSSRPLCRHSQCR